LIKSRISHPSSPLPSPTSNLTDFDLRNCLNVIYDIALDLSSISKGQKGEMTDDTLMDLRKQEDREFAKVVSGREFFPRQVSRGGGGTGEGERKRALAGVSATASTSDHHIP